MPSRSGTGLPFALGAILLWSTQAAFMVSLPDWPAPGILLATHLVGGVALNGLAGLRLGPRDALSRLGTLGPRVLAIGLLGTVAYQTAYLTALRTAPPVEANALNYLWPLCTALLAVPVRREKLTLPILLAAACGIVGLTVLVGSPAEGDYPLRLVGYASGVAGAVCWGLYSNLLAGMTVDPLTAQRAFLPIGAVGFALVALVTGAQPGHVNAPALGLLVYAGIGPIAGAGLLWQNAMQRGPVQRVAMLSYLTPVLSTLWLVVLTGASLTPRSAAGLALVLAAAALPSLGTRRRKVVGALGSVRKPLD